MSSAPHISHANNQSGSTLVVAILILVVLSAVCMFAANIIHKEIQVAGNDKFYRTAFFNADGAVYGTAKLVSQLINTDGKEKLEAGPSTDAPGIEYLNSETDPAETFLQQIMDMTDNDTNEDLKFMQTDPANDFGLDSTVEVRKIDKKNPEGGGAEFGSMAEGAGTQVVVTVYRMQSEGNGPAATKANIFAEYWKFVGIAGGL